MTEINIEQTINQCFESNDLSAFDSMLDTMNQTDENFNGDLNTIIKQISEQTPTIDIAYEAHHALSFALGKYQNLSNNQFINHYIDCWHNYTPIENDRAFETTCTPQKAYHYFMQRHDHSAKQPNDYYPQIFSVNQESLKHLKETMKQAFQKNEIERNKKHKKIHLAQQSMTIKLVEKGFIGKHKQKAASDIFFTQSLAMSKNDPNWQLQPLSFRQRWIDYLLKRFQFFRYCLVLIHRGKIKKNHEDLTFSPQKYLSQFGYLGLINLKSIHSNSSVELGNANANKTNQMSNDATITKRHMEQAIQQAKKSEPNSNEEVKKDSALDTNTISETQQASKINFIQHKKTPRTNITRDKNRQKNTDSNKNTNKDEDFESLIDIPLTYNDDSPVLSIQAISDFFNAKHWFILETILLNVPGSLHQKLWDILKNSTNAEEEKKFDTLIVFLEDDAKNNNFYGIKLPVPATPTYTREEDVYLDGWSQFFSLHCNIQFNSDHAVKSEETQAFKSWIEKFSQSNFDSDQLLNAGHTHCKLFFRALEYHSLRSILSKEALPKKSSLLRLLKGLNIGLKCNHITNKELEFSSNAINKLIAYYDSNPSWTQAICKNICTLEELPTGFFIKNNTFCYSNHASKIESKQKNNIKLPGYVYQLDDKKNILEKPIMDSFDNYEEENLYEYDKISRLRQISLKKVAEALLSSKKPNNTHNFESALQKMIPALEFNGFSNESIALTTARLGIDTAYSLFPRYSNFCLPNKNTTNYFVKRLLQWCDHTKKVSREASEAQNKFLQTLLNKKIHNFAKSYIIIYLTAIRQIGISKLRSNTTDYFSFKNALKLLIEIDKMCRLKPRDALQPIDLFSATIKGLSLTDLHDITRAITAQHEYIAQGKNGGYFDNISKILGHTCISDTTILFPQTLITCLKKGINFDRLCFSIKTIFDDTVNNTDKNQLIYDCVFNYMRSFLSQPHANTLYLSTNSISGDRYYPNIHDDECALDPNGITDINDPSLKNLNADVIGFAAFKRLGNDSSLYFDPTEMRRILNAKGKPDFLSHFHSVALNFILSSNDTAKQHTGIDFSAINIAKQWENLAQQYSNIELTKEILKKTYPDAKNLCDVLMSINLLSTHWPKMTLEVIQSLLKLAELVKQSSNENLSFGPIFLTLKNANLTHVIEECLAIYLMQGNPKCNEFESILLDLSKNNNKYFTSPDIHTLLSKNLAIADQPTIDLTRGDNNDHKQFEYSNENIDFFINIKVKPQKPEENSSPFDADQIKKNLTILSKLADPIRKIIHEGNDSKLNRIKNTITIIKDLYNENLELEQIKEKLRNIHTNLPTIFFSNEHQDFNTKMISKLLLLALARELHYCITFNQNKKAIQSNNSPNTPKGKWLRLEQAASILLLDQESLLQIDTSEGKTLSIGLSALIETLLTQKTSTVITHTESDAIEGAKSLKKIAHILSGDNNCVSTFESSKKGFVHYTDLANAVVEKMRDTFDKKSKEADGGYYIFDEVDNILLDTGANTTIQYAEPTEAETGNEDSAYIAFLDFLLDQNKETITPVIAIQALNLNKHETAKAYWTRLTRDNQNIQGTIMGGWIKSLKTADKLYKDIDFHVTKNDEESPYDEVNIVEVSTTGRMDTDGEWSLGVHALVARKESTDEKAILIPKPKRIIIENSSVHYTRQLRASSNNKISALSGTLGTKEEQTFMQNILGTQKLIIPRANRVLEIEEADKHMPSEVLENKKKTKEKNKEEIVTIKTPNLRLDTHPLAVKTRQEQFEKICEQLAWSQNQQYSSLVFFESIEACHAFKKHLEEKGLYQNKISIYDDTDSDKKARKEKEIIFKKLSSTKGNISLTTTSLGRGTDFSQIDVGILATNVQNKRTEDQILGRIGRNFQPGITFRYMQLPDLFEPENHQPEQKTLFSQLQKIMGIKNKKMRTNSHTKLFQEGEFKVALGKAILSYNRINMNDKLEIETFKEKIFNISQIQNPDKRQKAFKQYYSKIFIRSLTDEIGFRQKEEAKENINSVKGLELESYYKTKFLNGHILEKLSTNDGETIANWNIASAIITDQLDEKNITYNDNGSHEIHKPTNLTSCLNTLFPKNDSEESSTKIPPPTHPPTPPSNSN